MNATAPKISRKTPAQGNVFKLELVHDSGAKDREDMIRVLETLLDGVRRGRLTGMSYVCLQSDEEFFYGSCGYAHRHVATSIAMSSILANGSIRRAFGGDD